MDNLIGLRDRQTQTGLLPIIDPSHIEASDDVTDLCGFEDDTTRAQVNAYFLSRVGRAFPRLALVPRTFSFVASSEVAGSAGAFLLARVSGFAWPHARIWHPFISLFFSFS